MSEFKDSSAVCAAAVAAVEKTIATDIHTHLFPPSHGNLLLWGADELLTYHYLVAELFTVAPRTLTYEKFWKMSKTDQADLIWKTVFLNQGALSEAARGVITTFNRLGLDVGGRDLAGIRKWFAGQKIDQYLPKVLQLAGLDYAVMTNDPFKPAEVECWDKKLPSPEILKTALRIDTLILNWKAASQTMKTAGYKTKSTPDKASFKEARRFLVDWAKRIKPLYFAASLPPDFAYPSKALSCAILKNVVLPVAQELNLPMAMMIGVRKAVNPPLGDGGDAVGIADVTAVTNLCAENPGVKFLVTMLSRVNQHELCIAARKFGNLHLFGCWWFCNDPSIIDELTKMRLELLGATFTANHSDARVLDQLIYKWHHTRQVVGQVLGQKYADLYNAGWRPTSQEIQKSARLILGGAFEEFMAK